MTDKITSWDKPTARNMRELLNAELKALGEKYGLTIAAQGASFTEQSCTFKVELTVQGGDTRRETVRTSALAVYGNAYLPGVDLEKEHTWPSLGQVKITGWNTKAREYPVNVTTTEGKVYKVSVADVLRHCK